MRKDTHSFMTALNEKIPLNQGYKFSEVWQYSMQKLAGLVTLAHFLKTNAVAGLTQVAEVINGKYNVQLKFYIDNNLLNWKFMCTRVFQPEKRWESIVYNFE